MAGPWEKYQSSAPSGGSPFDSALAAEGVSGRLAEIARSIFQQESSSGANTKTSNAGAVGGMQIIPATFSRVADKGWDINNPEHNLRAGIRYIKTLEPLAGGDPALIAAGYYGGEGAIPKARQGVAISDPRNPNAPNTLQYGRQVASRVGGGEPESVGRPWERYASNPDMPDFSDVKASVPATGPTSRVMRVAKGGKDVLDAGAQMAYNALPTGVTRRLDRFNNILADYGLVSRMPEGGMNELISQDEKAYQAQREAAGESGIDAYRLAGNIAGTLPVSVALPAAAATTAGRIGLGALGGAAAGSLQPVTEGDFATEKAKQVGIGAGVGALIPGVGAAAKRIISPNAASNAELRLLRDAGVRPTVGQAAGGLANQIEQKSTSIPIVGDAISAARRRGVEDFNKAAINKAVAPIGASVDEAGTAGIAKAQEAVNAAYEAAKAKMGGIKFDGQFGAELNQLTGLAQNLTPDMARKFTNELRNRVVGRMSPSGGMTAETFKNVDSELGKIIRDYGKSAMGSEKEFANAMREVQASMRRQAMRLSPEYANSMQPADAAFAGLLRPEAASKAAALRDGVFTPGQFLQAIRSLDTSGRKSATASGKAMLQDLGTAGQNVLGNTYPDSGSIGRLSNIVAAGAGAFNPAIATALIGGAGAYTSPVQRALVSLIADRPQGAKAAGDFIANQSGRLSPAVAALLAGRAND